MSPKLKQNEETISMGSSELINTNILIEPIKHEVNQRQIPPNLITRNKQTFRK